MYLHHIKLRYLCILFIIIKLKRILYFPPPALRKSPSLQMTIPLLWNHPVEFTVGVFVLLESIKYNGKKKKKKKDWNFDIQELFALPFHSNLVHSFNKYHCGASTTYPALFWVLGRLKWKDKWACPHAFYWEIDNHEVNTYKKNYFR